MEGESPTLKVNVIHQIENRPKYIFPVILLFYKISIFLLSSLFSRILSFMWVSIGFVDQWVGIRWVQESLGWWVCGQWSVAGWSVSRLYYSLAIKLLCSKDKKEFCKGFNQYWNCSLEVTNSTKAFFKDVEKHFWNMFNPGTESFFFVEYVFFYDTVKDKQTKTSELVCDKNIPKLGHLLSAYKFGINSKV